MGRKNTWLYLAVALISSCVFISQILLSDVLGIIFHYDFRFLSATLALSGLGGGGIAASIVYNKAVKRYSDNLLIFIFLYLVTLLLPYVFTGGKSTGDVHIFTLVAIFISSFVNVFIAGLIITLIFNKEKGLIYKLIFFDLLGASISGVVILFMLDLYGIYSTIPFLFFLGSILFISFWMHYKKQFDKRLAGFAALFIFLFLFITRVPFAIKCPDIFQGIQPVQEKSNSFSHISLYEIEKTKDYSQINILINCTISSTGLITRNLESIRDKLEGFRNTPFELASHASTLIIGSGAGVDVNRALITGGKNVTAVEINPLIVNFTNQYTTSQHALPYKDTRVHSVIDEARSYISKTDDMFDLVVIAHSKNFGRPLGTQLFVPKNLYTLEAFTLYDSKIRENGSLAIIDYVWFTRQYLKTLSYMLEKKGINPNTYLLVLTNSDSPQTTELIMYKKDGFGKNERIRAHILAQQKNLIVQPDIKLLTQKDISIITDDRPFLWQNTKNTENNPLYPSFLIPNRSIVTNFLIIIGCSFLLVVISFVIFMLRMKLPLTESRIPLFFVGISLGLASLEFVLINKLSLLLNNPVYAHIIILALILLSSGFGSLASSQKIIQKNIKKMALLLICVLILYFFFLDDAILYTLPLAYVFRILVTSICVIVPGFLSGIFFPIGLARSGDKNESYLPWLWGIDTLAFIAASLLISFSVLFLGIRLMLMFGITGYLIAMITAERK